MPRSLLALLVIAIGLGLFLWLVEMPAEQRRVETAKAYKALLSFRESDVRGFLLHSQAGEIEIVRKPEGPGTWIITKPKTVEADANAVEDFLRTLVLAKVSRVVDDTGADLVTYGLASPVMTVSLHLPSGTETIRFGDPGPLTSSLYAQRSGDQKVLLTTVGSREILTKSLQDFRRKRVVEFDRNRVTRLKVTTGQDTVVLYKQGHGDKAAWIIKAPAEVPADQPEVRSLLFGLEDLKAQAFLDDPKDRQSKKTELEHPLVSITVHQEISDQQSVDQTVTLYANPQNTMSAFAETTSQEPLYIVSRPSAKDLAKNFFALRNKQLIAAEPEQVKTIMIKKDGEEYSLTREGNDWLIDGDPRAKADAGRINTLVARVIRVQAERPVTNKGKDLKIYGLASPVAAVTAADQQGHVLGRIAIGRRDDNLVFAQGSGMEGIVLIRPDILTELPNKEALVGSP